MPKPEESADRPDSSREIYLSSLADRIAGMKQRHDNTHPLWAGPCGEGDLGGITQSMISRFLSCRERFRLKYLLGLELPDRWNHKIGYGNMWHVCEEALAKDNDDGTGASVKLMLHTNDQIRRYPLQREEITKWWNVCMVQFPEYVHYWRDHPDVRNRTPLLQEEVFDVPYRLPSGRTVRLRGKWDSVDLIKDEVTGSEGGIYLQENKTKADVDKERVERQMKFDLQTMVYLIALHEKPSCDLPRTGYYRWGGGNGLKVGEYPIRGVRYNVIRRPLSGGKGNISPHKERATKTKFTPRESNEHFYERLRADYIAAEPDYWFFRVRTEVSSEDIKVFRETCLDPILEQICWWYDEITGGPYSDAQDGKLGVAVRDYGYPPMNYRTPFGVWSALEEDRSTEYDAYLTTGSEAGLRRVESLFPELQS